MEAQLSWDEAYTKAEAALSGLSLEDKVGIVTGVGWDKGACVGNTSPVASIGYPSRMSIGESCIICLRLCIACLRLWIAGSGAGSGWAEVSA